MAGLYSHTQDLHILALLAPAGLMSCFTRRNDGTLFLILYGITAVYFSGVMVSTLMVTCAMNVFCRNLASSLHVIRHVAGAGPRHLLLGRMYVVCTC
jgi:hypothetical protein